MLTPAELVWLLASVAKKDEASFERLYEATRAKLFGVVLRILRRQDLAEEVVQEAYVKIWDSAGQFNPRVASPITWMVSIAGIEPSMSFENGAKPRSKMSRRVSMSRLIRQTRLRGRMFGGA